MTDEIGFAPVSMSRKPGEQTDGVPSLRRIDLLARLSGAFDLAEGQDIGHSARVAQVADAIAKRMGLHSDVRERTRLVALLHDAGVAVRDLPSSVAPEGGHTAAGAWVAELMGLDAEVQHAIRCTHERWDGAGRPFEFSMRQIPLESLLVSAAHWISDIVVPGAHPLRARATALASSPTQLSPAVGGEVAEALFEELRSDAIWMSLWQDDLPAAMVAESDEGEASPSIVVEIASGVGAVVDSATREHGRAANTATLARLLAGAMQLSEAETDAVEVAALLMDIGNLGVPRHILDKPAILSIDEMEAMRRHPGWSAQLIEQVPGLEVISTWVQSHHERPDGRGYPEMLERDEIPIPSRILAVADAYWALRAARPYRQALSHKEAVGLIVDEAGGQFDPDVADILPTVLELDRVA